MTTAERDPQEWFHEAARCYIEKHQGCPWCGGAHRVFERKAQGKVTYSCHRCDFRVSHDETLGRYTVIPGECKTGSSPPDTMYEI